MRFVLYDYVSILMGVMRMDIFETLHNEKFFNPLTGVNKRIYFACITELIEYSKTVPVLYETEVRNTLDIYLTNKRYHVESEADEEEYDERDSLKIIRKFRNCGWLSKPELGRNGEYITNITSNCRRIIDFLNRLSNRKSDAAISNRILSMYEILQGTYRRNSVRRDRPYSSVLVPLLEDEAELKNEVLDLKDSISIILTQITEISDLSGMGNYLLADAFLEKFFNDYFYMKNKGMIPSLLKGIADNLRKFRNDELFDKAVAEYSQRQDCEESETRDLLKQYIDEMYYYITVEYPDQMEAIDSRINKYYQLANLKIRLLTSNGYNLPSSIDEILTKLKDSDPVEKQKRIEQIRSCIVIDSQKYISRKSYQKKKRQINDVENVIDIVDLSEEEKDLVTWELMDNAKNPYSLERTNDYFDRLFESTQLPFVKSRNVMTKEEALMFVSAFIYSQQEEFDYEADSEEKYETIPVGEMTEITVRRKDR